MIKVGNQTAEIKGNAITLLMDIAMIARTIAEALMEKAGMGKKEATRIVMASVEAGLDNATEAERTTVSHDEDD